MAETQLPRQYRWLHLIHQVTGRIALKGAKLDEGDYAFMIETLSGVIEEMKRDQNGIQFQDSGGPPPGGGLPSE
jgi:hypothetical protein